MLNLIRIQRAVKTAKVATLRIFIENGRILRTWISFMRHKLHNYLGGICKNLECNPVIVGGYTDHIHLLCLLSKKITVVTLLRELKADSSKWIKSKGEGLENFYWQDGYGAFSVNPYDIAIVKAYIENQHEHHRRKTFQEEYRAILKKYDVEYDERFIWD